MADSLSFDLVIVGGGSAGFAAAIKGAEVGARVALIEGGTLGGTCVNIGCVPSKTLIRAAESHHRRAHHGFAGIDVSTDRPDWSVIRAQKDELVASLRETKYWNVLRSYDAVTLIQQRAELVSGSEIRLDDGRLVTAGKIIIATGASPWAPQIPGLADAGYLDSTTAMNLAQLPKSLIVIGGSAVGLEMAQMFARLGVRVTVLEAMPRLMPLEDAAVGDALAEYLRGEAMDVRTGVQIAQVSRGPSGYRVALGDGPTAHTIEAEQLLVATGRRANTRGLGLETVGVKLGAKGEIAVDEYLQTSLAGVYAAGDVIGDPMFVYVAAYAGSLAAENALLGHNRPFDVSGLPRVTFTDPAVASVGFTESEARAHGVMPLVSTLPLTLVPRALAARETRGFVTLVADESSRKIIGAQIVASEAGEMITEPALAIRFGLTIDDIAGSFHPYLTLAEAIKLTAQAFSKDVSKLSCCAA